MVLECDDSFISDIKTTKIDNDRLIEYKWIRLYGKNVMQRIIYKNIQFKCIVRFCKE